MTSLLLMWVRTLFLRLLKILPSSWGGSLLWGWIYGAPQLSVFTFLNPTLLWNKLQPYSFFSPPPINKTGVAQSFPVLRSRPSLRSKFLGDHEFYSLDNTFPVEGVEPFQELGWDYFLQQQDSDPEVQQDFTAEEDYLYETKPGFDEDEDNPEVWELERFRWLETREGTYSRDDHPGGGDIESFHHIPSRGAQSTLSRVVSPGDGPVATHLGENLPLFDGYYTRWFTWADWYLFQSTPSRITAAFAWPEGYYYYLLYENRHTWAGDPTGDDITRWARNARGWPKWLFRKASRRYHPSRWRINREWAKRSRYNWFTKPWIYRAPFLPNRFRRRGYPTFRRLWRERELFFNPRANRWGAPFSGRTANCLTETDEWGYFENKRFYENSLFHRRRRLRERRQGWKKKNTRRRLRKGRTFMRPRWFTTPRVGSLWRIKSFGYRLWSRPPRAPILPWVAPRWTPAVGALPRSTLPPAGVVPGLILGGAWIVFWGFCALAPGVLNFFLTPWENDLIRPEDIRVPLFFTNWSAWSRFTVSGSFEGDYLSRVTLGVPSEFELFREGSPRERHSNRTFGWGAYKTDIDDWIWKSTEPVGLHWWSHPGIGANLLSQTFRRAAWIPFYHARAMTGGGDWITQHFFGFHGGDIANQLEKTLFFPYMDSWIPSWAHCHDVIGDAWVVFKGFRTWVDGGQELTTVRRMIDHRYNNLFDITKWLYKLLYLRIWPFVLWDTFRQDWLAQQDNIQRTFLVNPEWVSPATPLGGASQWELTYLDSWEKVTSSHLWPSNFANKRMGLGLSTPDSNFALDTRPRSRSEGFPYLGVPTRWELHFNRTLLEGWARLPLPDNLPDTRLNWINSRIELVTPRIIPWVNYLLHEVFYPIARWLFYVGGVAGVFSFFFGTWATPFPPTVGVQIFPTQRVNPKGIHPLGRKNPSRTLTGEGYLLRKEDRYFRRWGGSSPPTGNPERSFRVTHPWSWTPEAYWSDKREGFSRQAPRVGRRRRERHYFSLFSGNNVPITTYSNLSSSRAITPGGGLGFHFTRSAKSPYKRISSFGPPKIQYWVPQQVESKRLLSTCLFRGTASLLDESELTLSEVTFPSRGRRRALRGDDRLINREGTRALHRRGGPPRGWHSQHNPTHPGRTAKALLPVGGGSTRVSFFVPPMGVVRPAMGGYYLQRYQATLTNLASSFDQGPQLISQEGLLQLGRIKVGSTNKLTQISTPSPGYDTDFYRDEYFADLDGHQPDDGYTEHEIDTGGEEYFTFRYSGSAITLPPVGGFSINYASRLVSYSRFGALPRSFYTSTPHGGGVDLIWGGMTWGSLGGEHPLAREPLLGGYEVPRLLRRNTRQEELERTTLLDQSTFRRRKKSSKKKRIGYSTRFSLIGYAASLREEINMLGWSIHDGGSLEFRVDDLDLTPPGEGFLHGGGYTHVGAAGLLLTHHRPHCQTFGVWSPREGLNGWRYLVGESLGTTSKHFSDPEITLLEVLTTGYTDNYEEDIEAEIAPVFDRDPDDELEGENFEELDAEIPRSRAIDFPPWLIDEALGGASPGEISPEGFYSRLGGSHLGSPDGDVTGFRSSRRELRRHYRRGQIKVSRWRRKKDPLRFPRASNLVNESLRDSSPSGPDNEPLLRSELGGITSLVNDAFEDEEDDDELELQLWALTEVYYGDYPTGSFLDS